jgi:hypothetical protein
MKNNSNPEPSPSEGRSDGRSEGRSEGGDESVSGAENEIGDAALTGSQSEREGTGSESETEGTGLLWPKTWKGAYLLVIASFILWVALLVAMTEFFA